MNNKTKVVLNRFYLFKDQLRVNVKLYFNNLKLNLT